MAQKVKGVVVMPNLRDAISTIAAEPGGAAATVQVNDQVLLPRMARYTLSGLSLAVTEALDYGSVKVADLPNKNMLLLAVECDLVLTKQGNTDGIVAATDLDVGMGTAAASATTLATTMIDIMEKVDLDADALAVDFERHSNDQSTATFPKRLADSATQALYLNAVAIGGIVADSSLSVSGTVDVYYLDLGKKV